MNTANLITRLKGKSIRLRLLEEDPRSFATRGILSAPDIKDITDRRSELLKFITNAVKITSVQKLQSSPNQKDYAVSGSQKRILLLQEADPGSRAYNIPWSRHFHTKLQPSAFEKAWEHLLIRHESLRTVFKNNNGEYRQLILPPSAFHKHFEYLHLEHKPQSHLIAQSVIESETNQVFNIQQGPLVKAKLISLEENHFIFFICMHHSISDGWSINILVNELLALYDGFKNSNEVSLDPLPLQFKDYAAWEQRQLRSPEARAHREYWLQKLSGNLPVINLSSSTDPGNSISGGVLRFSIPQTTLYRLKEKCQETQVSLFMLLLTIYKILLFRYTGEKDIIVGSVLAGRDEAKLQGLIGFFVRTLAFRTLIEDNSSFNETLLQVKQTVLEAYNHQEYPFDQILEELQLPPADGNNTLFNTMLVLQNPEQLAEYPDHGHADMLLHAEVDAKFDILLNFEESNLGLTCTIEYRKVKFHRDFIRQLTQHYTMLVDAFLEDPQQKFAATSLMTGPEKQLILEQFNATASPLRLNTITSMFNSQVELHASRPAVCCEARQINYRQLQRTANKIAYYLINEMGVTPGDRIGMMVERNEHLPACILGILATGAAYVPVDPSYPDDRKEYILKDAEVKMTIVFNHAGNWKPETQMVDLEHLLSITDQSTAPLPVIDPYSPAYLIYTSGSTGRPKGVVISHRNAANMLQWAAGFHHPDELQGILAATSVCFDLSIYELLLPLVTGNSVIVIRNILMLEEYTGPIPITLINTVPSAANELLRLKAVPATVITVNLAGEPLSRELVNKLYALEHIKQVNNLYGPSETTTYSTWERVAVNETQQPFVGRPILNTQVYILNDQLSPVPPGFYGELYISGEGVAHGYYNKPELTAEKFMDNPFIPGAKMYKTGDLGRWMPDGRIQLAGRADDQVKVRGFRIELGEITDQLLKYPELADGIVIARTDDRQQKYLAAYFVPKEAGASSLVPAIRKHLTTVLPAFMIPDMFMELEKMPYTPNGKIDKNKLPSPTVQIAPGPEHEVIYSDNESVIAAIWEDLLGKKNIGTEDNFFTIGGHSLKATRMIGRIHAELGVSIPLKDIFDHPTIAALAARIGKADRIQQDVIMPLKPAEFYEISRAQKRLWLLAQSKEGNLAYNMPYVFHIQGLLDYTALMKTAFALVERHEALRTIFPVIDGEPFQQILSLYESGFRPEEIDLMGDDRALEKLSAISREEAMREFNLSEGPALYARLVRLTPDQHIVFFSIHHINMDAWTMDLLKEEAQLLYHAYLQQKPNPFKPLRIQYKEFAAWQNQQLESDEMDQHRNYWLTKLSNPAGPVELPVDFKRPDKKVFNGKRIFFTLDPTLNTGLRQIVKEQEATLFMVITALLKALFYQYSRKTDITIGSPISGRDQAGLEGVAGYFLNTLALRTIFNSQDSFMELLEKVKQTTREAYEHKLYPFDLIVEALDLNNGLDQSPLFNVLLAVLHEPKQVASDNGQDENGDSILNPPLMAKFDLLISFVEFENAIKGALEFNSDIFSSDTAHAIVQDFMKLAAEAISNPYLPLAELKRISGDEIKKILTYSGQQKKSKLPQSLPVFRKSEYPNLAEGFFITTGDRSINYSSFTKQVNRIANFLLSNKKNIAKKPVAILEDYNIQQLIAAHAVMLTGGTFFFLSPSLQESEMQKRMVASGSKLIISSVLHTRIANRLHWSSHEPCTLLITDSYNSEEVLEDGDNKLDLSFWDRLNETEQDPITGGGWFRSDTGQPFSVEEMDEYAGNIRQKLAPVLHQQSNVLEIGCSTGISLMAIAPLVKSYYGIDLSEETLQITRKLVRKAKLKNVTLEKCEAKNLSDLPVKDLDLIIINSTINHFPGHNYLSQVINKAAALLKPGGHIFVGDVMDEQCRHALESEMKLFKLEHPQLHTRTDFSRDLFIPRTYWKDPIHNIAGISNVEITEKIFTIANELTRYRYDVLLTIDPQSGQRQEPPSSKMPRYDLRHLTNDKKVDAVQKNSKHVGMLRFFMNSRESSAIFPVRNKGILQAIHLLQQQIHPKQTLFTDLEDYSFLFSFIQHKLVLPGQSNPDGHAMLELIKRENIPVLFLSPMAAIQLMDELETQHRASWPSCIRHIMICGDGITPVQWNRARKMATSDDIRIEYFFTIPSAFPALACFTGDLQQNWGSSMAGNPLPNHNLYVLDENGKPVPPARDGQLFARGPAMDRNSQGIFAPASKTKQVFPTGKKAKWSEDGLLQITGNLADYSEHSFREVASMEILLKRSGLVKDIVVLPALNQKNGKWEAWFVRSDKTVDPKQLRSFLRERFSDDCLPTVFTQTDQIPYLQNGLPDIAAIQVPVKTWRTETERQITLIWSDILAHEQISINKSFFETGGNSITALKLVSRINKHFSTSLLITDIFASPTIEMQAILVKQSEGWEDYEEIAKTDEADLYPVSHAQKRMWIMQTTDPSSVAYNMQQLIAVPGNISQEVLQQSLHILMERHESLRTIFIESGSDLYQRILHTVTMPEAGIIDLTGKEDADKLIPGYLRHEAAVVFHPGKGPLLRAKLFRLSQHKALLCLTCHHIISDGWSMQVINRDLLQIITAKMNGKSPSLARLKLQYRDFASWQNKQLTGNRFLSLQKYWTSQFTGYSHAAGIPSDYPRPAQKTTNGNSYTFIIGKELSDAFRKRIAGADKEATLFMGLLSITNILLMQHSGEKDIVIGSPSADRDHIDLEQLVGFFVQTLALRTVLNGSETFAELLLKVKEIVLGAYRHQSYPFDMLVEDLKLPHTTDRSPIFDIMLVLQNTSAAFDGKKPSVFEVTTGFSEPHASKFDLVFAFDEFEDGISGNIEFNTDLYLPGTIEVLAAHFKSLMAFAVEATTQTVQDFNMSGDEETQLILHHFSKGPAQTVLQDTLTDMFLTQVKRTPCNTALICREQEFTFEELHVLSDQLAVHLQKEYTLTAGDRIGLMAERNANMIIAMLAIFKLNAVYVPIVPELPRERVRQICESAGIRTVLISRSAFEERIPSHVQSCDLDIVFETLADRSPLQPTGAVDKNELAYIIFTSGTTGVPKGVQIEHQQICNLLQWCREYLRHTENDGIAAVTTASFDVSILEILFPLTSGARLILLDDIFALSTASSSLEITTLVTVPSAIQELLRENTIPETIHTIGAGGETLRPEMVDALYKLPHINRVFNLYGPTETTVLSTACLVPVGHKAVPDIGRPILNTDVYILNSDLAPAPVGVTGELYIGGHGVGRGYLGMEETTAAHFIPNPFGEGRLYKTGDRASWLPDGHIRFEGRTDEQVKVRGYRIEPAEIESRLLQVKGVDDAVVVPITEGDQTQLLAGVAAIASIDPTMLRENLEAVLPAYMVPSFFVLMDKLPLTANGKTDKKAIAAMKSNSTRQQASQPVLPGNEIEERLSVAWKKVLDLDEIGTMDDFFKLGGHSINAIRLIGLINEEFNIQLSFKVLFDLRTINAMGQEIEAIQWVTQQVNALIEEEEMIFST